MTRTTIKLNSDDTVTLTYTDEMTDERVERVFWIPRSGGYVREGDSQVCNYLDSRGATLEAKDGDQLLSVIRTEWKRRRARPAI